MRPLSGQGEKRPNGTALDPVAHFHLSNGARHGAAQLDGRPSPHAALQQSAGMMINYRYDLARIDANHESYRTTRRPAVSSAIKAMLAG